MKERVFASSAPLEEIQKELLKFYSKNNISRALKSAQERGLCYFNNGTWFMPLSTFLEGSQNTSYLSLSHMKGLKGVLAFVEAMRTNLPITDHPMIYVNPVDRHGVDVLINKEAKPYCVVEITNYARTSYLHSREIKRYIRNLNQWSDAYPDVFKVIVVSYPENLKNNPRWKNSYTEFVKHNIGIKVLRREI